MQACALQFLKIEYQKIYLKIEGKKYVIFVENKRKEMLPHLFI